MKTTHVIKTVGLTSAFSLSSTLLVSCDDDNSRPNHSAPVSEALFVPETLQNRYLDLMITDATNVEDVGLDVTWAFRDSLIYTADILVEAPFDQLEGFDQDTFTYSTLSDSTATVIVGSEASVLTLNFDSNSSGTFRFDDGDFLEGSFELN